MNIKEQIEELRDIEDDAYEGYASPEQCGRYADTMETLLSVYEAAEEYESIGSLAAKIKLRKAFVTIEANL